MFDDMEDDDVATDVYMEKDPSEEERESPLDREYQPRTMTVGEVSFRNIFLAQKVYHLIIFLT